MFRDVQKSEISPKNFGAGSILKEGRDEYLVIAFSKCVQLVRMDTFELFGSPVQVQDPNFLSSDEARALTSGTNCTMSDFDFVTEGLKGWKATVISPPRPAPASAPMRGIGITKM